MRSRELFAPLLILSLFSCRSTDEPGNAEPAAPTEQPTSQPIEASFTQDDLAQDADRLALQRQKQEVLAAKFVELGDQLLDQGDLAGSLEQYSSALEVMPNNEAARAGFRNVQALLGDPLADAGEFLDDAASREQVRREQARLEADDARRRAEAAMRAGNYDAAVAEFRKAITILQYHPLIADESLDEVVLRNRLETAQSLRDDAQEQEASRLAQVAEEQKRAAEADAKEARDTRLKRLYADAYAAFQRTDYRRAEDLANQILLVDSDNEHAMEMRDIAQSARHQTVSMENQRKFREEWLKTFEELDTSSLPQVDSIVFDDLRRWSKTLERKPIEFSRGGSGSEDTEAILSILDTVQVEARFGADGEGAPLEEVKDFLQQVTGVNFLITTAVRDELDEDDTAVELDLPRRSVRKILDIITETSEELRWKVEDGVVKFVTSSELVGGQVLAMYEVRDLIHAVPDFPGRDINISPSGGLEPPDEDFDEREGLVVTADALDALIRDNVATESWDEDPANNLRITESGTLVVNQTPEVQDQIVRLLEDLREATGIMVNIQARFLNVEDNFLEDIGVDFRGLGSPGLGTNRFFDDFGDPTTQADLGEEIGQGTDVGGFYDDGEDGEVLARVENLYDSELGDNDVLTGTGGLSFQWTYLNDLQMEMILRAVSKSERIELVTAPNLLVFNTARANLTVLNQVAYVQDYDVEIAQNASIADPIIDVIEDGVILDVRPVVSADRRFITLELRPTVAQLQRPIREVSTSLGTGGEVTIQLPEVEISRVRTSVPMPDGGTVLLGGLKIHEERQQRSGVPILNKIPLLSLLFERKGIYTTNRKLLILLKAKIVIPDEHAPTPAQLGLEGPGYAAR